jgi:hypothetical protein
MFRAQIRAIYRASAYGSTRIMFPMIVDLRGAVERDALCRDVAEELARTGVPFDRELPVGMMIETPSAVWVADWMAREAQFLSIGTNDLIQYTLAIDRDNERSAISTSRSIPRCCAASATRSRAHARPAAGTGVCGEMAGDPRQAVLLVGLGIDELSVPCIDLPRVKAAIRSVTRDRRARSRARRSRCRRRRDREHLREHLDPLLPTAVLGDRGTRVTLEPPSTPIDRGGMAARIEAIPDQIEQQLERLQGFRWQAAGAPEWLAVGAMGGSAIAAELSAALYTTTGFRVRCCGCATRVARVRPRRRSRLLSSYSGGTEETLALYREAGERRVRGAR